jgi:heat shock protein HtpX
MLARIDDPALPELLFERRRRLGIVTLVGALLLALLFGSELPWALPLLWLALLVSSYPVRRVLFGEQWGLVAFLHYAVSSGIAQAGLWLLMAFTPAIVISLAYGLAPQGGPAAIRIAAWGGAISAIVIALWLNGYARVWLDLHHATPLRESASRELVARFDAVLDRAAPKLSRRPEMYRFGAPGGYFMNALAIPSLWSPAVALSDSLLASLTDDEIVAVFAHEVAHHEQFTRRRLWISWSAGMVLTAIVGLIPLGLFDMGPRGGLTTVALLPLLIVFALGRRRSRQRDDETASDLRAAELTGNGEAVASALTKIHISNRVPRRWPHSIERAASHPSLARRIQALRTAAPSVGDAPVVLPATLAVVRSPDAGSAVAFDSSRAHWFEGVPADTPLDIDSLQRNASSYRAVAYGDLTELRIGASGDERILSATDRRGQSWTVPIAGADVGVVQTALDTIDVELGRRPVALRPIGMAAARLLAVALLIMLAIAGEAGVALLAILFVLFRPALTAAVAASAGIAFGRALVALPNLAWASTNRQLGIAGALAAAIALGVITVKRVRAETTRDAKRRTPREAWLLVVGLLVITVMLLVAVLPRALAHPASLADNPLAISAATTLLGIGASIATMSGRWRRTGGGLTSAAALAGVLFLSGDGWLFNRAAAFAWTKAKLTPAGSVPITGGALTVDASPTGASFAVTQYRATKRGVPPASRYLIGRFADSTPRPRTSDASSVAFLDDATLLALETRASDSLELRAERVVVNSLGAPVVLWRRQLPPIDQARVIVDRVHRGWIVFGRGAADADLVVITDTIGGSHPSEHRWPVVPIEEDVGGRTTQLLTAFGDGSTVWMGLSEPRAGASSVAPLLQLMASGVTWEIHGSSAAGEHELADLDGFPSCANDAGHLGVVCVERSAERSRVTRIVSASSVEHIGSLPSGLDVVHASGALVAAAERFGEHVAVLDAMTRRGLRLTLPPEDRARRVAGRWTSDIVAAGPHVIVLSNGRDGTSVRRYRIE